MIAKESGDTAAAIAFFKNTISLRGADYNSSMQLGQIYDAMNSDEALNFLNQSIQIDPNSDEAYYARGLYYQKHSEFELAMKDYQTAVDLNPQHYLAYYNAGNILADQAKYEKAIEHFKLAIKFNPELAKAYNRVAQCLELKGDLELAKRNYEYCLQIDPNHVLAKEGIERLSKKEK